MNTRDHNSIAAALATPEPDVAKPQRRGSSSFLSAVTDLQVGETASRAIGMDDTLSLAMLREKASEARLQMRNSHSATIARAVTATGGEYSQEVTDVMTSGRKWYVLGLITRTA